MIEVECLADEQRLDHAEVFAGHQDCRTAPMPVTAASVSTSTSPPGWRKSPPRDMP
jgi:hypothetical protein